MKPFLHRFMCIGFALGCVSGANLALAERYLTADQALKLAFPEADRFEARSFHFTGDQTRTIESNSGVKVLVAGHRWWIARAGTNILGVLVLDHVLGKHEIIDYAVAIAPNGLVRQVEVLEYRESHGYEIRGPKWRAQFKGKSAADPLKLNDDIYNLSGATLSCRHVTEGVKRVLATFELVLRPQLGAPAGGLPKPAP